MQKIFLIRNIAPEAYGGGESYQIELAEALQKNGFEPVIIATKLDKIKRSQKDKQIKLIRTSLGAPKEVTIIPFSAETKAGRDEIYGVLDRILEPAIESESDNQQ